jgi:hypothetical protein
MRKFVAASLLLLLLASPVLAGTPKMQWGWAGYGHTGMHATATLTSTGACQFRAQGWVQEIGKSGVTGFKVWSQLRGANDINGTLPTYASGIHVWLGPFPDDALSHWWIWYGGVKWPGDGVYAMWEKLVGMRPSFWQKDIVLMANLGNASCGGLVTAPGGL